jgi:hypothetical protein
VFRQLEFDFTSQTYRNRFKPGVFLAVVVICFVVAFLLREEPSGLPVVDWYNVHVEP